MAEAAGAHLLGRGVYTLPQAARLIRASPVKMRRWLFGAPNQRAVIDHDYQPIEGAYSLSFLDLIEARFIRAFRDTGVTLQHLRKVADKARLDLDTAHPFASARFVTDGRRIILEEIDPNGRARLVDYLANQITFEQFIRRSILAGVSFNARDLAQSWRPDDRTPAIIIDPRRSFGAPIIDRTGTPTETIVRSVRAEGDPEKTATLFELTGDEVSQASRFEARLAA